MICLYNVEGMLRKTIMILVCVGCCVAASAQTDLESLEKEYEANKRDIKVVKEICIHRSLFQCFRVWYLCHEKNEVGPGRKSRSGR